MISETGIFGPVLALHRHRNALAELAGVRYGRP